MAGASTRYASTHTHTTLVPRDALSESLRVIMLMQIWRPDSTILEMFRGFPAGKVKVITAAGINPIGDGTQLVNIMGNAGIEAEWIPIHDVNCDVTAFDPAIVAMIDDVSASRNQQLDFQGRLWQIACEHRRMRSSTAAGSPAGFSPASTATTRSRASTLSRARPRPSSRRSSASRSSAGAPPAR